MAAVGEENMEMINLAVDQEECRIINQLIPINRKPFLQLEQEYSVKTIKKDHTNYEARAAEDLLRVYDDLTSGILGLQEINKAETGMLTVSQRQFISLSGLNTYITRNLDEPRFLSGVKNVIAVNKDFIYPYSCLVQLQRLIVEVFNNTLLLAHGMSGNYVVNRVDPVAVMRWAITDSELSSKWLRTTTGLSYTQISSIRKDDGVLNSMRHDRVCRMANQVLLNVS
ncbi:hypothetical protein [Furfurilactobacillus rossiae]|nr:hypothetical protein [Furfurilactobacillus rossiae]